MMSDFMYWDIGGDYTKEGMLNYAGCNFGLLCGPMVSWVYGSLLTF